MTNNEKAAAVMSVWMQEDARDEYADNPGNGEPWIEYGIEAETWAAGRVVLFNRLYRAGGEAEGYRGETWQQSPALVPHAGDRLRFDGMTKEQRDDVMREVLPAVVAWIQERDDIGGRPDIIAGF